MSQLALDRLKEKFGAAVLETHSHRGDDTALLAPEKIVEACRFLKDDPELDFKLLQSVTCVDRMLLPEASPRFELVYHLYSVSSNKRVRLKLRVDEAAGGKNPEVDTVSTVWRTADWWERHVWDMYGVKFRGHTNLKRLYMYEEFVGHPLRKDYPLKARQPLIEERDFRDLVRGPGASPTTD
jgi:NADH-quinone oxidoreductase subunit C